MMEGIVVVIKAKPDAKVHGYDCDCCRDDPKDTLCEVLEAVGSALERVPEVEHEFCSPGIAAYVFDKAFGRDQRTVGYEEGFAAALERIAKTARQSPGTNAGAVVD